jgi:hypothetical protein
MHKLQNGSQVTLRPARKPQIGTGGYFSESNDNGAPSYPGQDWFNDCTDEFLNALNAMGIAYDPLKVDHLARALSSVNPVWNTSSDFIIGMRSVQSGQQYVAVQNSGPNNGGAVNPSTDTDWSHWKPVWALTQVENRLKGNQNWNIPGRTGHPLPDATPRDYPVGAEIALGIFCVSVPIESMTYVDGEISAIRGNYRVDVKSANANDFAGLKMSDGSIRKSGGLDTSSNGVAFSPSPDGQFLTVSFFILSSSGVLRGAHKFAGCGELPGVWPDVSDEESLRAASRFIVDEILDPAAGYKLYNDGYKVQWGRQQVSSNPGELTAITPLIPFSSKITKLGSSGAANGSLGHSSVGVAQTSPTTFAGWTFAGSAVDMIWEAEGY